MRLPLKAPISAVRLLTHTAAVLILTLLSQVGGVLYMLALRVRTRAPRSSTRAGFAVLFVAIYALAWWPVERLASLGGRVALPCIENASLGASAFSCVFHRHYVDPELLEIAVALAQAVDERSPGARTRALDGSFPFLDGVPLPPHLSHDDGEKLDFAFFYLRNGEAANGVLASPVGYWRFEQPRDGDPQPCGAGGWRWNMEWFEPFTRRDLALDEATTRHALQWLASEGARRGVGKVFVEPHLARRLGVRGAVIRFQGCRAARHDDHIHVQLR